MQTYNPTSKQGKHHISTPVSNMHAYWEVLDTSGCQPVNFPPPQRELLLCASSLTHDYHFCCLMSVEQLPFEHWLARAGRTVCLQPSCRSLHARCCAKC